jgi:hypothetical protein
MKLMISLLLTAMVSVASAQTFTNVVDQCVNSHRVFNFNYKDGPGNVDITQPLTFFVTFSEGTSLNIDGKLSHKGVTYSLFEDVPSSSPIVISPIDSFFGKPQGGSWSFTFDTDTPMRVYSWGVIPIPEPSTFSLALVGGLMLLCGRINKK